MKTHHYVRYECEICGGKYDAEEAARNCEAQPVLYDKGVKVGDKVLITRGDGKGTQGLVKTIFVTQPGWGPSAYNHARGLTADVIGSWGTRQLQWTDYEVIHGQ